MKDLIIFLDGTKIKDVLNKEKVYMTDQGRTRYNYNGHIIELRPLAWHEIEEEVINNEFVALIYDKSNPNEKMWYKKHNITEETFTTFINNLYPSELFYVEIIETKHDNTFLNPFNK